MSDMFPAIRERTPKADALAVVGLLLVAAGAFGSGFLRIAQPPGVPAASSGPPVVTNQDPALWNTAFAGDYAPAEPARTARPRAVPPDAGPADVVFAKAATPPAPSVEKAATVASVVVAEAAPLAGPEVPVEAVTSVTPVANGSIAQPATD